MDIENIVALAEQLKTLGFDDMASLLLKRICFKPADFIIVKKIQKDTQQIYFELYFERDKKESGYFLKFYDAILQNEQLGLTDIIGDISIAELNKKMSETDWKNAFDFDLKKQWALENKSSWQTEAGIAEIIDDLNKLEQTDDGKKITALLKTKYWSDFPPSSNFVNLNNSRNKQEIVQRFYIFDGQTGISVDEAFRFLKNRWLEKQMNRKTRDAEESDKGDSGTTSNGSGLLRKKRMSGKSRKLKAES